MFKVWKKARQLVKEEIKLHKNIRRIQKASLDYEALQEIVNNVATSAAVEIDIDTEDGMHIKIKPIAHNETGYESFYDKYNKQHNG